MPRVWICQEDSSVCLVPLLVTCQPHPNPTHLYSSSSGASSYGSLPLLALRSLVGEKGGKGKRVSSSLGLGVSHVALAGLIIIKPFATSNQAFTRSNISINMA